MNASKNKHSLIYDIALVLIVLVAFWLRSVGLDWDEGQHLHPDERFLTMVETSIVPVDLADERIGNPPEGCAEWGGYFDTACSSLNPNNRGHGFFVYGTLPIFTTRYVAEMLGQTGYGEVHLVGRQLSALADLLSIVVLYFIVARLYNRKTALLAAAFSAFAVLQIQQSHFFTVDTFVNFFMFLAIYFAVEIAFGGRKKETEIKQYATGNAQYAIFKSPLLWLSVGFGFALGMAVASKINAAVLAVLLPAALYYRYPQFSAQYSVNRERDATSNEQSPLKTDHRTEIAVLLIVGALASFIAFRIFQPYAFRGPSIFGVLPNQTWVNNIAEQRAQAGGDADLPFAFQWARRSHFYSFENLTKWGLGLPLGILAWAGFLWMGWRIFKGERKHLLLWGWTAFYFFWQSMQFNPTMRYQLPIYPLLAMMAAWGVFELANLKPKKSSVKSSAAVKLVAVLIGGGVLLSTALWAYAFVQIYRRPHTRVAASRWIYNNVPAAVNLNIELPNGDTYQQPLPYPMDAALQADMPYNGIFVPKVSGRLTSVSFAHIQSQDDTPATLSLSIAKDANQPPRQILSTASLRTDFSTGEFFSLPLDAPLLLLEGESYYLNLSTDGEAIFLKGSLPINESSWDDGLPLRIDGYDGFGGLYQPGLNMEMYWNDDQTKLERLVGNLSQGDYLFISSNRQWATLPRVPERYPLTSAYYYHLLGCPPEKDVIWCYNTARPGEYEGELGYELVEVFESFPSVDISDFFHWEVNDQFAEEAFTVYDHTKVLIFKKRDDFNENQARALLGAVDLSRVVHLTPKAAGEYERTQKDLLLSKEELARQRAGGTWSELFDVNALKNKYPLLGLLLWYFTVFVLGLFTYPVVRRIFPGLADKGYPLSRTFGLLLLAYFPWLLGSFGIAYSRLTIGAVYAAIVLVGAWQAYCQRDALRAEWRENRRYYLMIEGLFLAFFLLDLLIRIGNPDLWHPSKGGERPMDLSYLHAVIKSTVFPPYDPWYAGGYLNYYYFGFVLVGTPVKLLGLTPTTAYNFILPTLFAMVGINAFSVGWNLLQGTAKKQLAEENNSNSSFLAGISAAAGMILLGNLGTIRTVYHALQRMIEPNAHYAEMSVFKHLWYAILGIGKLFGGESLPIRVGDWYWLPSRVIPAPGDVEPITEFPLFTFLYSDLHAHMIVLPLTVMTIAWALSFLYARFNGKNAPAQILLEITGAALVVGALRPTNTWDLYAYLPLAALVIGYALFRFLPSHGKKELPFSPNLLYALGGMAILAFLATLFYQPYLASFGQAYGETRRWTGSHTPLSSYFTQWGLFLFVIVSWMWWESYRWMAETPLSALQKLKPYRALINFFALLGIGLLIGLAFLQVKIGWIAVPLLFWAGVLLLRGNLSEAKRFVLLLVGTALALTLVVEVIVLAGDIGRMNTVFKLYLQAWTLFALSAGASLAWLLPETRKWTKGWQVGWKNTGMLLFVGALLFTVTGTLDKVHDRVRSDAPRGLDGMKYMETAHHWDEGDLDLGQDYRGILWMRENVQGSPVIVEANTPEYRWGSRYTVYTGLPGVLGWNWHQRQQRALNPPNLVTDRVEEIRAFYETVNLADALAFIKKYDVGYIVVGQEERNYYPGAGLDKFAQEEGVLWDEVFRDGATRIYKVIDSD
jgi:YYY domain-containing protein